MGLRHAARGAVTHPALVPLWRALAGDSAVLFMLHRFADADGGVEGHSATELRANLEYLRRERIRILSVGDLLGAEPTSERRSGPTVVFTVDDGYYDFARIAAPIFAEFDVPVTVFLVTGAIDGGLWFWWDKVQFALEQSTRSAVTLELDGRPRTWAWRGHAERSDAVHAITATLMDIADDEKEMALVRIAESLEVDVPPSPPARFSAMGWDDVRRFEGSTVTFGPHTVTHPMLPQVDASRAEREIVDSWSRLSAQTSGTVPVFCYPAGGYTPRDIAILSAGTLAGAVTTDARYAARGAFHAADPAVRFGVPRFAYVEERAAFVQIAVGAERFKMALRRGARGWRLVGG